MKFYFGHYGQNFEHFSSYRRVNCNIERTMVPNAKKTAVLVLMPGLVDRFRSRTVPSLLWGNKNGLPSMKVKDLEKFQNKTSFKGCK